MAKNSEYMSKLEGFEDKTLFPRLASEEQQFIRELAKSYRLSFQEFRQAVEYCRDLSMWQHGSLQQWWQRYHEDHPGFDIQSRKKLFRQLNTHIKSLKSEAKRYSVDSPLTPDRQPALKIRTEPSNKKIHGLCPVASEKTVCCNLHTIDAVQNCMYGCSYCSIQTFYNDSITFDERLADKLKDIELEPDRFYHFGTGQASDSLVWGNRNGNLDALCKFANDHQNVLLEFKTKSDNISYLLEHDIPDNVVCSWSLNTAAVIANEEHLTVNLERRIYAARQVADKGIKVAFHFHPMVYYEGWDQDYPAIATELMTRFSPEEVRFISFGSVTLIKPVIKKIREQGLPSKILQMDFVTDPHGKMTYADEIKSAMFSTMYDSFCTWHDTVLIYLCMEKAEIWQQAFGFSYPTNRDLENRFAQLIGQQA
jgi:spore photoproduct lyase